MIIHDESYLKSQPNLHPTELRLPINEFGRPSVTHRPIKDILLFSYLFTENIKRTFKDMLKESSLCHSPG